MPRPNQDDRYLAQVRDWYRQSGVMPSIAELGELAAITSKGAAARMAARLAQAGYLGRMPGGRLKPGPRFFETPLASETARAGMGEETPIELALDAVSVLELIDARPSNTVVVRVKGESMEEAGIREGDYALIEKATTPVPGDIVLARVDGNHTIKEFQIRQGKPRLQAHNRAHPVIEPREALEVLGVVRGIVRRYSPRPSRRKGAGK